MNGNTGSHPHRSEQSRHEVLKKPEPIKKTNILQVETVTVNPHKDCVKLTDIKPVNFWWLRVNVYLTFNSHF